MTAQNPGVAASWKKQGKFSLYLHVMYNFLKLVSIISYSLSGTGLLS